MKRIPLTITAIAAVLALSAITAMSAWATEKTKVLPQPTAAEPISATGSSPGGGKLVAVGGSTLSCKKAKGEGSFTSFNRGTGKTTLEECKGPLSSTCTGEGDTSGVVLDEGTIEYLLALEMLAGGGTTLVGAAVGLQREFHFTCEALGQKQLILARGCQAGRDESAEKLTKTVLGLSQQFAPGETQILEILPPEATSESKCLPEVSINGAAFTLAAVVGEGTLEKFIKHEAGKTKEVEILLMNK